MREIRSTVQERASCVKAVPMFADLSDKEARSLGRVMAQRAYRPNEMLFFQGDKADGFFAVLKGRVKVCRLGQDGREQVLHLMGAGELVGEVPVFQGGRFPATALAAGDTEALYVPGDKFLELAEQNPHMLLEMLAVLSRRLRGFVGLIDDLALKEISARLAKHILDLRVRSGSDEVTLETTKVVLAARLGSTAETLSRTLTKMQKHEAIRVKGRAITILDREALTALAAGMKL